jgi:RNA polymerase sigma-70 factor, ECF subfamily
MSTSDSNSPTSESVQEARVTALLVRAASRDQAAWRELIGLYGPRVFAMANSRCRNDHIAEEITQGVFATVCTKLGTGEYEEKGRFESWLFRITMNRVRDLVRQRQRTQRILGNQLPAEDDLDAAAKTAPIDDYRAQHLARLRATLDQLPEADREIIELRHHGGLSFKQMSDLLGEPLGTLLARHHRAIQKLREMLADVGIELAGDQSPSSPAQPAGSPQSARPPPPRPRPT